VSLIEDLQADSLNTTVPITDLLRKAKATATKLRRSDFAIWTEQELSGYLGGGDVPQYRKVHADLITTTPSMAGVQSWGLSAR
jgi:hypothetical protein